MRWVAVLFGLYIALLLGVGAYGLYKGGSDPTTTVRRTCTTVNYITYYYYH